MGTVALMLVMMLQASPAPAQPPAPRGAAAGQGQTPPPAQPAAGPEQPPPVETYTYNPDGRRDPVLSLIAAGDPLNQDAARKGEGVAGMTVSEISVRGVVQSRGALIAMVQGPDNRTYMVRSGDKLADGSVQSITPEGLVIVQSVNDPLSLVKQRTVRKLLRSLEDVKQ